MRLGALLLMGTALLAPTLAAQGRKPLAWERLAPLDWQVGARPASEPLSPIGCVAPKPAALSLDESIPAAINAANTALARSSESVIFD